MELYMEKTKQKCHSCEEQKVVLFTGSVGLCNVYAFSLRAVYVQYVLEPYDHCTIVHCSFELIVCCFSAFYAVGKWFYANNNPTKRA